MSVGPARPEQKWLDKGLKSPIVSPATLKAAAEYLDFIKVEATRFTEYLCRQEVVTGPHYLRRNRPITLPAYVIMSTHPGRARERRLVIALMFLARKEGGRLILGMRADPTC